MNERGGNLCVKDFDDSSTVFKIGKISIFLMKKRNKTKDIFYSDLHVTWMIHLCIHLI